MDTEIPKEQSSRAERPPRTKREPLLIRQYEACDLLGISREKLIDEIDEGRLRYVKVGKRRKFKPSDLEAYIERQARECDDRRALLSDGGRIRSHGTKTSRSTVISFEEALRLTKKKPRTS
jgi:excisionase family DNA binding protein